ncbi:MAG: META domain-containing protein [Nocardioides sp.]|nr:META domain-containing protein [Nocardioides sp.]
MSRILFWLALPLMFAVSSCGGDSDDTVARDPDPVPSALEGRTLVVTEATEGGVEHELVRGSQVRFTFRAEEVRIAAGCNTLTGSYRFADGQLEVDDLASTEIACPESLMNQDLWIGELFEGPVAVGTGPLSFTSGNVVLTLAERATASPDTDLRGTSWRLDTLYDAGTASAAPKSAVPATISFEAKGNVQLSSYCNTGGGPVRIGDTTMEFGSIMMTQRACTDAAKQ